MLYHHGKAWVQGGSQLVAVLENCNLEIIVVIHLMIYFGKRIIISIPHLCFTQEEGLVCVTAR